MTKQSLEWFGVVTAIAYSLLVAANVGLEFVGFCLLVVSAGSIGLWAVLGRSPRHPAFAVFLCGCGPDWDVALVLATAFQRRTNTLHVKQDIDGRSLQERGGQ